MIEVLKQALADAKRNERHNNVAETRYWLNQYKLIAEQAIAELESQELKQVTVKDFVHIVEGKEDLIGRPVYFAQWPNGNAHPPQRTWVGLTEDDKVLIKHDANFNQFMTAGEYADRVQQLTEARLKDKNT